MLQQKGKNMPTIDKDLVAVGEDSILDLFTFVQAWHNTSTTNGDLIDQFMGLRTLLEVSEAIHLYSKWKEKSCRESKS